MNNSIVAAATSSPFGQSSEQMNGKCNYLKKALSTTSLIDKLKHDDLDNPIYDMPNMESNEESCCSV